MCFIFNGNGRANWGRLDHFCILPLDALPEKFAAIKVTVDTANNLPNLPTLQSKLLEIGCKH